MPLMSSGALFHVFVRYVHRRAAELAEILQELRL